MCEFSKIKGIWQVSVNNIKLSALRHVPGNGADLSPHFLLTHKWKRKNITHQHERQGPIVLPNYTVYLLLPHCEFKPLNLQCASDIHFLMIMTANTNALRANNKISWCYALIFKNKITRGRVCVLLPPSCILIPTSIRI